MFFDNAIGPTVYLYDRFSRDSLELSLIEGFLFPEEDSTIRIACHTKKDTIFLELSDTILPFAFAKINNRADRYLNARRLNIELPILHEIERVPYGKAINLAIEPIGDTCQLFLNDTLTRISELKESITRSINLLKPYERRRWVIQIFADKEMKIKLLMPILKEIPGIRLRIAYTVKPSYSEYSRLISDRISFNDQVFTEFKRDTAKKVLVIEPELFENISTRKTDLASKFLNNRYAYIELILNKEMEIQSYIEMKKEIYLTIDSLRDNFSKIEFDSLSDELTGSLNREKIYKRFPSIIVESME